MKAKVIIEKNSDGLYEANMEFIKSVPFGLFGQGKTVEETIGDFYNSYEEAKKLCAKNGKACPELEFEFAYDTAAFLQKFGRIMTLSGMERLTGVNQKQLGHYLSGIKKPTSKTVKKIEDGIRRFSGELSSVHLV